MRHKISYQEARELLLSCTEPVGTEHIPLDMAGGRVLAEDMTAYEDVPCFERSPYDGYAFRAADSSSAAKKSPAELRIIETVPCGSVPTKKVIAGTAVKVMTGAPIPEGADAVVKYENTEQTGEYVRLFVGAEPGENIVCAGEDTRKGTLLARAGSRVDAGLAGALAAQGICRLEVFRRPRLGLICTGSELVEAWEPVSKGKIRNSSRYILTNLLEKDGCQPEYLGSAGDAVELITEKIRQGLEVCDMIILTGGVSAGEYDLTPTAMEQAGCSILARGVSMKPGMACCFGICGGKLVCGLSGNPAAALTNYHVVVQPAVKKLAGRADLIPEEIQVTLLEPFPKKSPSVRFLRGVLTLGDGVARMHLPEEQSNVAISSYIGCNLMALVPAGSGALEAGTVLKAFVLQP